MTSTKLRNLIEDSDMSLQEIKEIAEILNEVEEMENKINKNVTINKIRDYVVSLRKDEPTVMLQAMRESELVSLINRYDTNEDTAVESYKQLQRIDSSKYKNII